MIHRIGICRNDGDIVLVEAHCKEEQGSRIDHSDPVCLPCLNCHVVSAAPCSSTRPVIMTAHRASNTEGEGTSKIMLATPLARECAALLHTVGKPVLSQSCRPGFFGELNGMTDERPGGTHCRVTLHLGGIAVLDPARRAQSP